MARRWKRGNYWARKKLRRNKKIEDWTKVMQGEEDYTKKKKRMSSKVKAQLWRNNQKKKEKIEEQKNEADNRERKTVYWNECGWEDAARGNCINIKEERREIANGIKILVMDIEGTEEEKRGERKIGGGGKKWERKRRENWKERRNENQFRKVYRERKND